MDSIKNRSEPMIPDIVEFFNPFGNILWKAYMYVLVMLLDSGVFFLISLVVINP